MAENRLKRCGIKQGSFWWSPFCWIKARLEDMGKKLIFAIFKIFVIFKISFLRFSPKRDTVRTWFWSQNNRNNRSYLISFRAILDDAFQRYAYARESPYSRLFSVPGGQKFKTLTSLESASKIRLKKVPTKKKLEYAYAKNRNFHILNRFFGCFCQFLRRWYELEPNRLQNINQWIILNKIS